jgi:hypothetical protein
MRKLRRVYLFCNNRKDKTDQEWTKGLFFFMTGDWTQALRYVSRASALPLEPRPQAFVLYFVFEIGSYYLCLGLALHLCSCCICLLDCWNCWYTTMTKGIEELMKRRWSFEWLPWQKFTENVVDSIHLLFLMCILVIELSVISLKYKAVMLRWQINNQDEEFYMLILICTGLFNVISLSNETLKFNKTKHRNT